MAKNEIYKLAEHLSLEVGVGVLSGDPVRVGVVNAVAQTDATLANNQYTNGLFNGNTTGYASCWLEGGHKLTVVVSAARKVGDPVYAKVEGSNKKATLYDIATAAKPFGFFLEDVPAAGTVQVGVAISKYEI